jgi:hypothetical protein
MPPSAGRLGPDDGGVVNLSAAALFAILWDALTGLLGTAAVAAIVRRAVSRAAAECPDLLDLVISHEQLEYRFTLPPGWSQSAERGSIGLRCLAAEIRRLLIELTGTVVIRHLDTIPELRACGLPWRTEETN